MNALTFAALLGASALTSAHAQISADLPLRQWQGTQVSVGTQSWGWTETNEDGSTYVSERGHNVIQLELRQTFSIHDSRIAHSVGVKLARGRITYDGAYIGGGAVTSTTLWDATEFFYEQVRPLGATGWQWGAGVSAELKHRNIWNPAAQKYQREDYSGGLLYANLQSPRPAGHGWYAGGGLNLTFATQANPYAPALGFKEDIRLKPTPAVGAQAHVGYAFSAQTAVELHWQQQRWGVSDKAQVSTAAGALYEIWQPASSLSRATLKLTHRF